jgi:hypothetical protein
MFDGPLQSRWQVWIRANSVFGRVDRQGPHVGYRSDKKVRRWEHVVTGDAHFGNIKEGLDMSF